MGINYLALNDLFQISNRRKDIINYEVCVQMVEIYNEQVRDLLIEDASTAKYPFILSILCYRLVFNLLTIFSCVEMRRKNVVLLDKAQIRDS